MIFVTSICQDHISDLWTGNSSSFATFLEAFVELWNILECLKYHFFGGSFSRLTTQSQAGALSSELEFSSPFMEQWTLDAGGVLSEKSLPRQTCGMPVLSNI